MGELRLDEEQANAIYSVLVAEAGAGDGYNRHAFVFEFAGSAPTSEWRFCGSLGFGGKFRFPGLTVDCYPEDETPDRMACIARTNAKLAELRMKWADAVAEQASGTA